MHKSKKSRKHRACTNTLLVHIFNLVKSIKKTYQRHQIYNKESLGIRSSLTKTKFHLEIIRRLTNNDRPGVFLNTIITQALIT